MHAMPAGPGAPAVVQAGRHNAAAGRGGGGAATDGAASVAAADAVAARRGGADASAAAERETLLHNSVAVSSGNAAAGQGLPGTAGRERGGGGGGGEGRGVVVGAKKVAFESAVRRTPGEAGTTTNTNAGGILRAGAGRTAAGGAIPPARGGRGRPAVESAVLPLERTTSNSRTSAPHRWFPLPLPVGAAEAPTNPTSFSTRRSVVQPSATAAAVSGSSTAAASGQQTQQSPGGGGWQHGQQPRAAQGAAGAAAEAVGAVAANAGVGRVDVDRLSPRCAAEGNQTPRKPFRSPGRHFRDFVGDAEAAGFSSPRAASEATGQVPSHSASADAAISSSMSPPHSRTGTKTPRAQSHDQLQDPQATAWRSEAAAERMRGIRKQGRRQTAGLGVSSGPGCVDQFNLSMYGLNSIEHALDDGYETQAAHADKKNWLLRWRQSRESLRSSIPPAQQVDGGSLPDAASRAEAGERAGAVSSESRKASPAQRSSPAAGLDAGGDTRKPAAAGQGQESSLSSTRGGAKLASEREKRMLLTHQHHRARAAAAAETPAAVAAERQQQHRHNEKKDAAERILGGGKAHANATRGEEEGSDAEGAAAAATRPWVVTCAEGVWQRQQLPAATSSGGLRSRRGSMSGSTSRGRSSSVKRGSVKRSSSTDNSKRSTASTKREKSKAVLSVYGVLQKQKGVAGTVRKERPSVHKNNQFRGALPIRVFCGTWNCEYQELPVATMVESSPGAVYESLVDLPQQLPEQLVEELLEDEDAWATAAADTNEAREEGKEEERAADSHAASSLSSASQGSPPAGAARGTTAAAAFAPARPADAFPPAGAAAGAAGGAAASSLPAGAAGAAAVHSPSPHGVLSAAGSPSPPRMVARGSLQRKSTLCLRAVRQGEEPLRQWVLPGYDVYVITLQETISDSVFHAITLFLRKENGRPYRRLQTAEDRISGLGDGAWTQFKSTSIAAWVREDYMHPRGPIELIASKAVPLSFFNGSKGAVSVLLKLWDQHTCFLGCHMPASSTEDRARARIWILGRLCEWYGGVPNATLDAVFHHVVWMGDFNFRTKHVAAAAALKLLEDGQLAELLQYDECFSADGRDLRQAGFEEAPVTFPPTYKKADGRPAVNVSNPHWPEKEYQTKYTVKWYKGRHQEDRVPSWTDRVFKWSLPELRSLLRIQNGMYYAAMPEEPSNFLNASDHSPVACCMECFPLDPFYAVPPVLSVAACASQHAPS